MLCLDSAMNNTTVTFQYPKPYCIWIAYPKDSDVRTQVLIALYATLTVLIITVNLLSINGIIKTKTDKFNSSQVLFLILFASDMTIGTLQLPLGIYVFRKAQRPTCFELQLHMFSFIFPTLISGSVLCVISIDRYINVVSNTYYKKIVTKNFLPVTIVLVTITSFTWSTVQALLMVTVDKRKLRIGSIALATYWKVAMVINVTFNLALLRNVKKKAKHSTTRQSIGLRLTKTISIIVATFVAAFLPAVTILHIFAYAVMNSSDINFIHNIIKVSYWVFMSTQLNAVLNSVIYLSRNSRIKKYYCNLFKLWLSGQKCTKYCLSSTI